MLEEDADFLRPEADDDLALALRLQGPERLKAQKANRRPL